MRTISQLLLTFLLNAGWQIAMITAVAVLCDWLLSGTSAHYRHLLWVAALVVSFCLPVPTSSRFSAGAVISGQPRPQTMAQPAIAGSRATPQLIALDTPGQLPAQHKKTNSFILINRNAAAVLVIVYLLFLCYRSLKLVRAWMRTRVITRSAYPIEQLEHVQTIIDQCQRVLGVTRVQILCSNFVAVPMTVGSLKPLVIVPEQLFREADPDVITSAIGHELAHVLRRDYLLNLIYEVLYLPLSFHPAASLVRRRIKETRELSCDELVTERLLKAEVYARSLVKLASTAVAVGRPTTIITVGITDADILEERVMKLLKRTKISVRRKNLLLLTAALLFIVPCGAAAPFALSIGISPRDVGVRNQDTAVISGLDVPQDKRQAQEKEERLSRVLREYSLTYQDPRLEARRQEKQQIQEAKLKQELEQEAKRKIELEQEAKRKIEEEMKGKIELDQEAKRRIEEEMKQRMEALKNFVASQSPEIQERRRLEQEQMAREQAEMARQAKITMQQAIQIATNQQPGTAIECRLAREADEPMYKLRILSVDEPESTLSYFLISAIDGRVVKSEKEKRGGLK